jgi:hypothetical protein
MKGGKAGRKRRSAGGAAPRPGGGQGKAARPSRLPRPDEGPPKKGARKKPHYGGTSTTREE